MKAPKPSAQLRQAEHEAAQFADLNRKFDLLLAHFKIGDTPAEAGDGGDAKPPKPKPPGPPKPGPKKAPARAAKSK
jgi:hypothetical protein